jgi:predicted porin
MSAANRERSQVNRSRTFGLLFLLLITPFARVSSQEASSGGADAFPQVSFEGLFYLNYETGTEGGVDYARFNIHRAYLTTRIRLLPKLSGRVTFDTSQDHEGDGRGDMEVRLKYAHAKYDFGDWGQITGVGLEGGIVHTVWLDFEEHVDLYRMRDPMFMERNGIFNSADFGLTLSGGIGGDLPEEYRKEVNSHYASRYGSFAVGVYNGAGYHGEEMNQDKVAEGRLTIRPLPEVLPGFQLSGLAILGKGNQEGGGDEIPDWHTYNLMASYQFPRGTLTAQYARGKGNQKGSWTEPDDPAAATDFDGYSLFGEYRLGPAWRLVAGFDDFTRTPGSSDRSFTRVHGGVGYDLGGQNILLLDLDRLDWDDADIETDTRLQVVMQVKF